MAAGIQGAGIGPASHPLSAAIAGTGGITFVQGSPRSFATSGLPPHTASVVFRNKGLVPERVAFDLICHRH